MTWTYDGTLPRLAEDIVEIVRSVILETRPGLIDAAVSGDRGESVNVRHEDNFLSVYDIRMHRRYRELLTTCLDSFVYASEEAEPKIIGDDPDPDLCILVDPLDTSELAVRGLHGYTHVMAYSRSLARPVVAVVGDIFHHIQLYVAARNEQGEDKMVIITADSDRVAVDSSRATADLAGSLVTNYLMRPRERFMPLARQGRLIQSLGAVGDDGRSRGRIGVDFGSVGLCHVAAGFTDAMVEFAKGFAVWDLAPGHYILHTAGGVVLDLGGEQIPLDYHFDSLDTVARVMDRRQRFVAARTTTLAQEILGAL